MKPNKFFLSDFFKNIELKNKIAFNITLINYTLFSNKNVIKVEYLIKFYDINKNILIPSDITLKYNIHVLCALKEFNTNNKIISLSGIYENKCYKCIEIFNQNDKIIFGIKIYIIENFIEVKTIYFFKYNYNSTYVFINDFNYKINCLTIKRDYKILRQVINKNKKYNNNSYNLKKSYIKKPICSFKKNYSKNRNKWYFANIYNYYFCFCKGSSCLYENILQKCKYYFYLYIIDINQFLYNKTDYLFGDFIYILNNIIKIY